MRKDKVLIPENAFIDSEFKDSLIVSNITNDLYTTYNVKKGLRNANGTGVLVLLTKVSDVCGYKMENDVKVDDEGRLYYRGYDIYDLIGLSKMKYGFERVCFLILFSKIPTEQEILEFHNYLSSLYELPNLFVEDNIFGFKNPSVMNQIQKCVLSLYCYDDNPDDVSPVGTLTKGLSLLAKMPALTSYCYRSKRHYVDGRALHIRKPNKDFSIAENILRMSRKHGEFLPLEVETLDLALILQADHGGGNNSTFANIVISSTATDIYSSMVASLGSLKGPRHGGANKEVKDMMKAIINKISLDATDEQIRVIINKILDKKFYDKQGLIYGIGHAVYTKSDPRAVLLKEKCKELAEHKGQSKLFDFYTKVEAISIQELRNRKGSTYNCCANVDFYSGLAYEFLDIAKDLFTPLFACARIVGWLAHNIENKLYCDKIIRPAGKYVGEIIKKSE